jgi:hypothetical protein
MRACGAGKHPIGESASSQCDRVPGSSGHDTPKEAVVFLRRGQDFTHVFHSPTSLAKTMSTEATEYSVRNKHRKY